MSWSPTARAGKWWLTLRSTGAPTASHQGPPAGTLYIFCRRALASCRRRPLSSNVRPRQMRDRGASTFMAMAAAATRGRQRASLPPRTRHPAHQDAIRNGCVQARNTRRLQPPASWPIAQRSAIRGSAAPGSQRFVFRGARGVRAGGASHGARTNQQPTLRSGRYSAPMATRTTKSDTFRRSGARPNPVFNRTPCGSPRLALISFWAKRGLPQGAG